MSKYMQNTNAAEYINTPVNHTTNNASKHSTPFVLSALTTAAFMLSIALSGLPNPSLAYAHPLTNDAANIQNPIAIEQSANEQSPLDAGITLAINKACGLAVTEGTDLLSKQADMVSAEVAQNAAAAEMKAQKTASKASVSISAAPSSQVLANTINVDGDVMSYINAYLASTAPSSGAGLWMGSDSTTDGTWGYFIGHNPGPFHHVMDLVNGDAITVTDSAGNSRTYYVIDTFTVPDSSYWEDIQGRVSGYGESVILQTCCGDNANYRIVVAK